MIRERIIRGKAAVSKPTGKTRTYTVAKDGFLMNTFRRAGDKITLQEKQAYYLIRAGQLVDPDKKATVKERAHAAFAAHGAGAS